MQQNRLQDELSQVNQRLQEQEHLFDLVDDDDLIEAIIYEQKALRSRYAYLIKQAKEQSLHLEFIERNVLKEC